MRKIYLLLLFITSISFAQKELNLDNNLTCNTVQADEIKNIGFVYSGSNSLTIENTVIDFNTNYSYLTNTQNELSQKLNVSHKFNNQQLFLTYQFNSSYLRDTRTDNWIGVGYGFKKNIGKINTGISYATVYQDIHHYDGDNQNQLRHSVRCKLKYDGTHLTIQSEYWYQPTFQDFKNYIVTGNTKLSILPKNDVSFIVQDMFNYNSKSSVKIIHTISFGIQYKFNKKF